MHRAYVPQKPEKKRPLNLWGLIPWLLVAYLSTGIYTVQPNERAVVQRCGKFLPGLRQPGLHLGFPYGIDKVTRIRIFEHRRAGVGMSLSERLLGRRIQPQEAECLTGDYNLVVTSAVVQYRIADPRAYLLNVKDVDKLVSNTAASCLTEAIVAMTIDELLTTKRVAVQNQVRRQLQSLLDKYGSGVEVTAVSIEGTEPPQEVIQAFRDVMAAREDSQRMINEAQSYANQLLPQTRGEAQQIIAQAEADAQQIISRAQGDAQRFLQMVSQLSAQNRKVTFERLLLEAAERILPRLQKVIVSGEENTPLDLGIIDPGKLPASAVPANP